MQPSLFFAAEEKGRPLLVALHTWSYDRHNLVGTMLPYAEKYGFNLLCPEFRGSNLISNPKHTEACGSIAARTDIKDAIDEVIKHYDVDGESVFLIGLSGGGHMAMLMAGFCPEYFRAVAAVVPISDLSRWCEESPYYATHVRACCGDDREEMLRRSPVSYMAEIARANLKIFHGKYDKTVPFTQSMSFYNAMLAKHPEAKIYLDIFDGGHEIDIPAAMHWFMTQGKGGAKQEVTG